MTGIPASDRARGWLLALAVLVIHLPAVAGGWLWDDDTLVHANPQVVQPAGLVGIWAFNTSPDYFPLTTTSFWLEYRLWGAWPPGYRAVNVVLHAVNAVLVWRILVRLGVPWAWVAALLWGVHPVNVSSVAWVAERKNTLSMLFACLAVLGWMRYDERGDRRTWILTLAAFVAALLAKTSLVTLPLVFPLLSWWRRGEIRRIDLERTLPFLVASFVLGVVTLRYQMGHQYGAPRGIVERIAELVPRGGVLAGRAVGFYLAKDLWPARLAMVYPRWELEPAAPSSWIPTALLVAALAATWRLRAAEWARAVFMALAAFVILLLPVLGFLPATYMNGFSFVADHWQYTALVAPVALAVAAMARAPAPPALRAVAAGFVVAAAAVLTVRHTLVHRDTEVLWRHNNAVSGSWAGHTGLARALERRGRSEEALAEARIAVRKYPLAEPAWSAMAKSYESLGRHAEAAEALLTAWRLSRDDSVLHNAAVTLAKGGDVARAEPLFAQAAAALTSSAAVRVDHGLCLRKLGRNEEAERSYREALEIDSGAPGTLNALAYHLATTPGGDAREAVGLARRACRATDDSDPAILDTLATALAASGEFADAVRVAEDALARARAADDAVLVGEIEAHLAEFRAGRAWVER